MATAQPPARPPDRSLRRRPFSTWMRRLANLKHSSPESAACADGSPSPKRNGNHHVLKAKKVAGAAKHNPYPASGYGPFSNQASSTAPGSVPASPPTTSVATFERSGELADLGDPGPGVAVDGRSGVTTASTEAGTGHSDTAQSTKAGSSAACTSNTNGRGISSQGGGAGSTFSSAAPSERSLTTTLTTVQSTAPSNLLSTGTHGSANHGLYAGPSLSIPIATNTAAQSATFSNLFPSSPPVSALPPHLTPHLASGNPSTYTTATANNLLTDNASILTLASSSKRQRRHSLDTNASMRALAPSSLWGGSRESLPLSVLSASVDPNNPTTPGLTHTRPSVAGIAINERASVYSLTGGGPGLSGDRNSFYAGKQNMAADSGSVKSSLVGHGRTDSISGSIGGASLIVASPKDIIFSGGSGASSAAATPIAIGPGKVSRRNSEWAEVTEEQDSASEGQSGDLLLSNSGRSKGV
ncbi:MAG: hypothetical protein M1826_000731 [Phylliscum demangeonii]|nr:MAG: hypothetical protein M1826_000731 [Phylliscum demangeonii]